jgi:hypothetical protein
MFRCAAQSKKAVNLEGARKGSGNRNTWRGSRGAFPFVNELKFRTDTVAFNWLESGRPDEADATERDFMLNRDYPTRLRELERHCRRAAEHSYELEAKTALRTISERLSNMADEIEQSGNSRGDGTFHQRH